MRLIRTFLIYHLGVVAMLAAPAKEIVELQRDVAALQDQVRRLEVSLTQKLTELETAIKVTLDTVNRSNATMTVVQTAVTQGMAEQSRNLAAPVASMNSKIDQMASEFQNVQNQVADLTARMGKLQTDVADVGNAVKTMANPPAPPPPGATGSTAAASPPPGMSAKQIYDDAMRDRSGGNFDLAMKGFSEYLKYYGNTELAPNAQFYIGQIHYDKSEFPHALLAFDAVLERFPENNKTADAMYMKGMSLLKSGQRTEAGREFLNVIQKYPNAEVAAKARSQRRALGLSVPTATVKRRG